MKPAKIVAVMSSVAALLAGTIVYIDDLDSASDPPWLIDFAAKHKSKIALGLFVLTLLLTAADWLRSYVEGRHESKRVLAKILNELSGSLFPNGARRNRITLFSQSSGWRLFFYGLLRNPLWGKPHKWKALFRLKWREDYLGVYLRPMDSKGRKSTAAFQVSDDSQECEGVAGRIWDIAGQWMVTDLPRVETRAIRRIASQSELESNAAVKAYASKTNMLSYRGFDACDHFATHYYGTLIRRSDGTSWGVLLLDSFVEECPFTMDGEPSPSFVQRFNDFATIIGKIVS